MVYFRWVDQSHAHVHVKPFSFLIFLNSLYIVGKSRYILLSKSWLTFY